jgi:uncharacterized protein YbaR (Trm112 family)
MKESLLEYLQCPVCQGDLTLNEVSRDSTEIVSGELLCSDCPRSFPIRNGVPRLIADQAPEMESTAKNFGAQWTEFDHIEERDEAQFLDWIAPVTPAFMSNKVVLEGGCGKARHTRLVSNWGAQAVIGIDLSDAVDAAYRNTRDCPNAHIIQADIHRLPLKPVFDYAFSVGVLHHLPDPRRGFLSLAGRLRRGGSISTWVYGRENNGWVIHLINPIRSLTSRLPFSVLYRLSYIPTAILYMALKLIYAPLSGSDLSRRLFYGEYLGYISKFRFREIHNIVHDHLTAPIAHYITREEIVDWFREVDAEEVKISWHNRNSWRGVGQINPHVEATRAQ